MADVIEYVQFGRPGTYIERDVLTHVVADMGFAEPAYIADAIMERLEKLGFKLERCSEKE